MGRLPPSLLLAFALLGGGARGEPARERVPHVDLALRWDRGRLTVEKREMGEHPAPTPEEARRAARLRARGRFEARLLVDGKPAGTPVRFDFPLLADADAGEAQEMNERMRSGVRSRTVVRLDLAGVDPARAEVAIVDGRGGRALARLPLGARPAVTNPAGAEAAPRR